MQSIVGGRDREIITDPPRRKAMHKFMKRKFVILRLSIFLMLLFVLPHFIHAQTESEPNDRRDQANEIRLGESAKGYFHKRGDYDWYRLVISDPGKNIIRIDLSGVPGVDVSLEIYDENGHSLKRSSRSQKGEPEAITRFGIKEGTYFITAYGRDISEKDPYTLSTRLIGPWEEGQEFEPNDDMHKANEIRLGETIQGLFQAKNEPDWYKLVIDKPGKNIIRVDLSGVEGVNPFLFIHDAQGYQTGRQAVSRSRHRRRSPERPGKSFGLPGEQTNRRGRFHRPLQKTCGDNRARFDGLHRGGLCSEGLHKKYHKSCGFYQKPVSSFLRL
jgi:hypothetical protein